MSSESGLLVLDKPSGPTSADCVQRVKRVLGDVRVGHCGTLDPMAQGVLLILFGSATRLQDQFLSLEKQYWFRARWGVTMDTGDRDGKEIARHEFAHIALPALVEVVQGFEGEQMQIPPVYSALKYKGRRYYEWARRGIEIPRVPRPVQIASFKVVEHAGEFWEGRVICSRGTYIRTLAEDVAKTFQSGAYLDALIRERVGPYRREDALSLATIDSLSRDVLLTHVQNPLHHHARLV